MLTQYSEAVEKSRIMEGLYASKHGDRHGCFYIKHPSGVRLTVMASDGGDWKEANLSGPPWEHVSVSTTQRTPTWEEMCFIKDLFFAPEECVVQFHPPKSQYVNHHPNCLHLWKPVGVDIPLPPSICVGLK